MDRKLVNITLFSACWAIYSVLSKAVFNQGIGVLNFTSYTFFFGSLFLFMVSFKQNADQLLNPDKKILMGYFLAGLFGNGLSFVSMNIGLALSTASNFGFLIKTSVAFGVILAFIFLKEPLSKMKAMFIFILLLGAYLISTNGKLIVPNVGDLLILLAAFFTSISTVTNKFILKEKTNLTVVAFYRLFVGFIVVSIATFVAKEQAMLEMGYLLLSAVGGGLMALTLYFLNKTLEVASASYATMMSMMLSVFVLILSLVFLDESFSLIQYLGALIVVLGSIGIIKTKTAYHK